MVYVMIGWDGPEGAKRRDEHRAGHVAHLDGLDRDGRIVFAGPIRNEENDRSDGAVIVFEAESLEAARQVVAGDPYVVGGVFASYTVRPFRQAYPKKSDND